MVKPGCAGLLIGELGFSVGLASPCSFWHQDRRLRCSVYGDDFTTSGPKSSLDWFIRELRKWYKLTESARLGLGSADDKEAKILNCVVRWTADGIEYEADPLQAEKLIRELSLEGAKVLGTPGVKPISE